MFIHTADDELLSPDDEAIQNDHANCRPNDCPECIQDEIVRSGE